MFTRPEQSRFWLVIGFVVRRRAELTVIAVGWLVLVQLETDVTPGLPGPVTPAQWAWLLMAATCAVVLAVPPSRRYALRRCSAVVMRHRMRACFLQTRTWTANGRLPFLVWSRPTPVGVRVRVWLPAGLSVNDLERIIDEIGAACWAREARITPVQGQAALVWVDVIRRDPLGAQRPLSPPVVDHVDRNGHPAWLPTPQQVDGTTAGTVPAAPTAPSMVPLHGADGSTASQGGVVMTKDPSAPKNGAAKNGAAPNGAAKNGAGKNGAAPNNAQGTGSGAQADPPGVTGFGGVDVTDYV